MSHDIEKSMEKFVSNFTVEERETLSQFIKIQAQKEAEKKSTVDGCLELLISAQEEREKIKKFVEEETVERIKILDKTKKKYEEFERKNFYAQNKYTIEKCLEIKLAPIIEERYANIPKNWIKNSFNDAVGEKEEKIENPQKKKKFLPDDIDGDEEEEEVNEQNKNYGHRGGKYLNERNSQYGYNRGKGGRGWWKGKNSGQNSGHQNGQGNKNGKNGQGNNYKNDPEQRA